MKAILRFDNVDTYREGEFSGREPVTVGRDADNLVALPLNVLSRHHARVFCADGDWFVEDLDSANGTFHRGQQLQPNVRAELANGDIVHFGTVAMSISFLSEASAGEVKVVEKVVEKIVEKPVEKVVEKIVEKVVEKPVDRIIPRAIASAAAKPSEPAKPFRPGLKIPEDLRIAAAERKIRL